MAKREPKPYQPGLLVTARTGLFVTVAVVAVLAHAGVGYWTRNVQIVSSELSDPQPVRIISVRRAPLEDYTYRPQTLVAEDTGPTAEELTRDLLESGPASLTADPLELNFEPRPLDELNDAAAGTLSINLPEFNLGEDLLAQLDTRPPTGLEFGQVTGEGGGGDGTGDGTGGPGSSELANNALDTTEVAPNRTNTQTTTTLVDRTQLDGPGGVSDVPPQFGPSLDTPQLDFVELALGGTTRIDVPENLDTDFTYRVTRYDPTDWRGRAIPLTEEAGYFRVDITAQQSLRKLQTMPKDVVFIIDTSSSISETWVGQVSAGVRASLVSLNEGDRFNIVLFNDQVSLMSDTGPVANNRENLDAAYAFLNNARSVGYTDVNAAMRGLLIRDVQPGRVYDLVLISDGLSTRGVVDSRRLLNLITRDNDNVANIYCVGVGDEQDRELLNFLAYRNMGRAVYAENVREASIAIQELLSELRFPIIQGVQLNVAGLDNTTVYPTSLPTIHQGQTLQIFGRYSATGPFTMSLTGQSAGQPVEFTFRRSIADAAVGPEAVANDWARWKLHDLFSQVLREGERPELMRQIEQLQDDYDLDLGN